MRSEGGVGERSDSFDVDDLGLAGRSRGREATVTVTARPGRRGRSGSRGAAWDLELAATRRWCKCSEWRAVKAFDIAMDMAMAAWPESGRSRGWRLGRVCFAVGRREDMGILTSCCLVSCRCECDCASGPTAFDSEEGFLVGSGAVGS